MYNPTMYTDNSLQRLHKVAQLYADATALQERAQRCRDVAHTLAVRKEAISQRAQPVFALHNDSVWQGRAADASRAHLQRVTGMSLYYVGQDLATLNRALLVEAETLTLEASAITRQARTEEAEITVLDFDSQLFQEPIRPH